MSMTRKSATSLVPGDVVVQNYSTTEGGKTKDQTRSVSVTSVRSGVTRWKGTEVPVLSIVGVDTSRPVNSVSPEKFHEVRWFATPESVVSVLS
jgi:hypothetical protein